MNEFGLMFAGPRRMPAPMVNAWIDRRRRRHNDVPDFIIERWSGDSCYRVIPQHQRAMNWLQSVGDSVAVDDRCLEDLITAAVWVGFTVALRFAGQERVFSGSEGLLAVERIRA
jgi:hypothetical protein